MDLISCRICSHCSEVGSTPVGLCAHAWSKTIAPDGAAPRSSSKPVFFWHRRSKFVSNAFLWNILTEWISSNQGKIFWYFEIFWNNFICGYIKENIGRVKWMDQAIIMKKSKGQYNNWKVKEKFHWKLRINLGSQVHGLQDHSNGNTPQTSLKGWKLWDGSPKLVLECKWHSGRTRTRVSNSSMIT